VVGVERRGVDVSRLHGNRRADSTAPELEQRGIALCFARLKGRQREIFEETGLTARIGHDRFFHTLRTAVAAFEANELGLGTH
jgi:hypothetical protein